MGAWRNEIEPKSVVHQDFELNQTGWRGIRGPVNPRPGKPLYFYDEQFSELRLAPIVSPEIVPCNGGTSPEFWCISAEMCVSTKALHQLPNV